LMELREVLRAVEKNQESRLVKEDGVPHIWGDTAPKVSARGLSLLPRALGQTG
jgi:hypothetical protein